MMWKYRQNPRGGCEQFVKPGPVEGDDAHASAVAIGRVDAIPPGGLVEVEAEVEGEPESLILHRDDAGAVRAWRNICPHAGRRRLGARAIPAGEGWKPGVRGAWREFRAGGRPLRRRALPRRSPARAVAVRCVDGEATAGRAAAG